MIDELVEAIVPGGAWLAAGIALGAAFGGARRAHARVEHHTPGRVRVRVAREERSPEHMERVRRQLEAHPDVAGVDVNPQTGSVLVRGEHANGLRAALEE